MDNYVLLIYYVCTVVCPYSSKYLSEKKYNLKRNHWILHIQDKSKDHAVSQRKLQKVAIGLLIWFLLDLILLVFRLRSVNLEDR
jgi:hypothetical protein